MIHFSVHKKLQSAFGEMSLDVDLRLESGTFLTVYGKSGAGKTTLLRIIAGLVSPDNGKIVVNGNTWLDTSSSLSLMPQKRDVGFVFQDYALFPNMNVRKNLEFALQKGQNTEIIDRLIAITQLGNLQHQRPTQLSGGQQQRVALARALVQQPQLLLLDEPLSSVDNSTRMQLQEYILEAHKTFNFTTILVSHDVSEVLKLSDKMVVLNHGKIVQEGTPQQVFSNQEALGTLHFKGVVISIKKRTRDAILSLQSGNEIITMVVDEKETEALAVGDSVSVSSATLNPSVRKM